MKTMKRVRLTLLILLLIIIQPTVHAQADQIILANGDQISGEILVISDNKIRLVTEYAGEIEVDFDKVESLSTDKTASIVLTNGDLINGKIDSISEGQIIITSEAIGVIEVQRSLFESLNETGPTEEDLAELEQTQETLAETEAALTRTKEDLEKKEQEIEDLSSPLNLWSGSVALGIKLERGNSNSSDFNFDLKASREAPRDKLDLRLLLDYEETDGEADTNSVFGSTKLQVFQTERRYVFGATILEYDEFEDLDLRAQIVTGPGYYFIRNEKTDLFGEIGGGIVGEFIEDEDETLEGIGYLHIGWKQKILETAQFTQDITFLPNLSDVGEYRVRFETALTTPIRDRWALKLSILDDFDSDPESEDVSKNDLTFVTALEYTF
jgi:putative salt-induced outer membrane protein YdiY